MIARTEYDYAIESLYKKMYGTMCVYAESVLQDGSLAEEAVQDTFQIACSKQEAVLNSENPEGWLMITLKYVMKNMKRRQVSLNNLMVKVALQSDLISESPEDEICFDSMCQEVLGESDHRLIKRVIDEKYTMLEAAEEFGITVHACKKRVQRAKEKLRNNLKKEKIIVSRVAYADTSIVKGGKHSAGK